MTCGGGTGRGGAGAVGAGNGRSPALVGTGAAFRISVGILGALKKLAGGAFLQCQRR